MTHRRNSMDKPSDWKNYEDFSAGIDTNRLPKTDELTGKKFAITFTEGKKLELEFTAKDSVKWCDDRGNGQDWYEAVKVDTDAYFLDRTFAARPRDAQTLIVNTKTGRVLSILSHILEDKIPGESQVTQVFEPGVLEGGISSAMVPAPTRDFIGLRTRQRYSPNHLYEHTYLNSQRFCWQCLEGEQRGHGDTEMASYYKFDNNQYIFTWREFIIPVAAVLFYNFSNMRSTGKFLGLTGDGKVANDPAGAFVTKTSMNFYDLGCEPL